MLKHNWDPKRLGEGGSYPKTLNLLSGLNYRKPKVRKWALTLKYGQPLKSVLEKA